MLAAIRGQQPQLFNIEVLVEKVSIVEGEHQNINPPARKLDLPASDDPSEEIHPEQPKHSPPSSPKNMRPTFAKQPEFGKNRTRGTKTVKESTLKEAPAPPANEPPPPEGYKLLPPLSLGIRLFEDEELFVEQIDLPIKLPAPKPIPPEPEKPVIEQEDAAEAIKEVFKKEEPKGKKKDKTGKYKKGAGKKGKDTGKNGKDTGKTGKERRSGKERKATAEPVPPSPPNTTPLYTQEELLWKLPDEERFGRGWSVTTCTTGNDIVLWLQRGAFRIDVYRWPGKGERQVIGYAKYCILPQFAETVVKACNKESDLPLVVRSEGEVVIRDSVKKEEIGSLQASFRLTCFGRLWMSEGLLSQIGLLEVLATCPAPKNPCMEEAQKEDETKRHITYLFDSIMERETIYRKPSHTPITTEDIMYSLC